MVSNKMVEAGAEGLEKHKDRAVWIAVSKGIESAIDAAWIKFDDDDPETYPKSDYTPCGGKWLVVHIDHDGYRVVSMWRFHNCWSTVIAYLDPADIIPSFAGNEK